MTSSLLGFFYPTSCSARRDLLMGGPKADYSAASTDIAQETLFCIDTFVSICHYLDLPDVANAAQTCHAASVAARAALWLHPTVQAASTLPEACKLGFPGLVERISHPTNDTQLMTPEIVSVAFVECCKLGHLLPAQLLAARFNLTTETLRETPERPTVTAISFAAQLQIARWHTFFSSNMYAWECPLCLACSGGHLEFLQWLVLYFKLTAADIQVHHNIAFRFACQEGHLSVAQWLAAHFDVPVEDVMTIRNAAFDLACQFGQLETAKWLFDYSKFTPSNARENIRGSLTLACMNGRLNIAQWIVSKFELSPQSLRAQDNVLFYFACFFRQPAIAQWLATSLHITVEDIRKNSYASLHAACASSSLELVQWLTDYFALSAKDFSSDTNDGPLNTAQRQGNTQIVQWIIDHFNLPHNILD